MNKEELLLQKRLAELSRIAYTREIVTFSEFLNLNELNILHTTPKDMLLSQYKTYGGYGLSERQMAAFLPDALYYDYQYPIQIIEISPVNRKFAEELSHRDYLGAVMNLGIERCKLGDILIEDGKAILFAKEELAGYIMEHLTRIRHTTVKTSILSAFEDSYEPRYEELKGTVASVRLDTVLSLASSSIQKQDHRTHRRSQGVCKWETGDQQWIPSERRRHPICQEDGTDRI